MTPRLWFESSIEMPASCARPPIAACPSAIAAKLLPRSFRKKPASAEKRQPIGAVSVGLVWRRIACAFAWAPMHAAFGGGFAMQPSCGRPGLEHRQVLHPVRASLSFRQRGPTSTCRVKSVCGSAAPRAMSLSMPRPIRHTGPRLFSAAPVVDPTTSPSRPCKTLGPREGSHAAAARNALRADIDDARLAACDYAMYDCAKTLRYSRRRFAPAP